MKRAFGIVELIALVGFICVNLYAWMAVASLVTRMHTGDRPALALAAEDRGVPASGENAAG